MLCLLHLLKEVEPTMPNLRLHGRLPQPVWMTGQRPMVLLVLPHYGGQLLEMFLMPLLSGTQHMMLELLQVVILYKLK